MGRFSLDQFAPEGTTTEPKVGRFSLPQFAAQANTDIATGASQDPARAARIEALRSEALSAEEEARRVSGILPTVGRFLKALPEATTQVVAGYPIRTALGIGISTFPGLKESIGEIRPEDVGPIGRFALGEEPIRGFREEAEPIRGAIQAGAQKLGVKPEAASKFSLPLAFALTAANLDPGLPNPFKIFKGIKAISLTDDAARTIAASTDATQIRRTLGNFVTLSQKIPESVLDDAARRLVNITDPDEVKSLVGGFRQAKEIAAQPESVSGRVTTSVSRAEKAAEASPREAIGREYLQGYRNYVAELEKTGTNPVSFEEFARFKSMQDIRRAQEAAPPGGRPPVPPEAAVGPAPKPEPAAPDRVGNIRLDKFDLPDESKAELARVIRENDEFVAQRRGVQTFKDTEFLADATEVPRGLKPGTALAAEELEALGRQVGATRVRLDDLARRIKLGANDDETLAKFAEMQQQMVTLLRSYSGATAETGRSLSILRNIRKAIETRDPDLIRKAMRWVGDRDELERVAYHLAAFEDDDLIGKYRFIQSLQKPKAADWLSWYWYTSLLSGPKTQIRNILGNVSNITFNTMARPAAVAADWLAGLFGKEREMFAGEIPASLHGLLAGVNDGWNKALFMWRNGFTMDDIAKLDFRPPEVSGGLKTNIVGRTLDAADIFFRSISSSSELHARAYAEAVKKGLKGEEFAKFYVDFIADPPLSAMKEIAREGSRAVFRQEQGKIVGALLKLKDDFNLKIGDRTIRVFNPLKFVIPFISTPANIIKTSLEATPAGFATSFFRETVREARLTQGRAAMGTLALLPLAIMAAKGRISGSGPEDKEIRDLLFRTGWQPNSIHIGDKWYNYSNFQPLALPLSLMANAFEQWHYGGKDVDVGAILAKTGNSLLEQSYLRGLSALQQALESPESFGKSFIANVLGGLVPFSGLRGQLARATDETIRQPETIGQRIQATIPGATGELQPKLSALGQEATRETGLPRPLGFLSNFLSPVDIRQVKDTPLERELLRLRDDVQIGFPAKTITVKGERIELTAAQRTTLIRESGTRIRERLEKAVANPRWERMPDDGKAKFIKKVVDDEREQARKLLMRRDEQLREEIKSKIRERRRK